MMGTRDLSAALAPALKRAIASSMALALLVATTPAGAQSLERKPYIQGTSTTRALVVWTMDSAADAVVRYGASPGALDQQVTVSQPATQHEVEITGLSPDTRYYYSVETSQGQLAGADDEHYFVTAPPTGSTKKFRAWVVGDSGTGESRQAQVRDAMLLNAGKTPPDIYLHLGDMAYTDGTTSEFSTNFFRMYEDLMRHTVVWPTMGNHEGHSADAIAATGPYYTAYALPAGAEAGGVPSGTEAYYSFDWGNVHFIVLESHQSDRSSDGAMLTWAQEDLIATDQDWIIAYWHHPPYTKGSHDSDTEGSLIEMRENALPILEAAGVDLVLGGHSHIYERSFLVDGAYETPTAAAGKIIDNGDGRVLGDGPYQKLAGAGVANDGAVYVVAGHGGTGVTGAGNHPLMFFSEVANGSCLLDVQGNRIGMTNIRWDGVVSDRFTIVKGSAIVVGSPDGGERYQPGETRPIRWATVGSADQVRIELSLDGGDSWQALADAAPNTGSFDWQITAGIESDMALVRVTSMQDAAMADESNGTFAIVAESTQAAIPFGSTWRYHDGGMDLGNEWLSVDYDDSSWGEGAGELGFGDDDEATALAPGATSYYFRKSFELGAEPTEATLRILHDDGVVVWINGLRVFELYAEDGVAYEAWATNRSQDNEIAQIKVPLSPYPFTSGRNIITALVKQHPDDTDDLSFDLELSLELPKAPASAPSAADGCGCHVDRERESALGLAALTAAGLALARRRRRRPR